MDPRPYLSRLPLLKKTKAYLDSLDYQFYSRIEQTILYLRHNRKATRYATIMSWFIGSSLVCFFGMDLTSVNQERKLRFSHQNVDQVIEYIRGSSQNDYRALEVLESFIDQNMDNTRLDLLGCLYLAKFMEASQQVELSYQFLNLAHLTNPALLGNNSRLPFDISKDSSQQDSPDINALMAQLIG